MAMWLLTRLGKREELESLHLGAQGCHHQYEGASNDVGSKGDMKPKNGFGGFGGLAYKLK